MREKRLFVGIALTVGLLISTLATPVTATWAQNAEEAHDLPEHDSSVITVYREEDGLPTGEANTILQTKDGYIWIGSYGGLIRYDGENFRNYSTEGLIGSSSIRALFEDSKGRLWIGTNDKGVYVYEKDQISKILNIDTGFLCIRDFAEASDGTIYVASTSGLAKIDEKGELSPYHAPRLEGETVYTIAADTYNRVWATVNSGICLVVDGEEVVEEFVTTELCSNVDSEIYSATSTADGTIYLGTYDNYVIKVSFANEALSLGSGMTTQCYDTGDIIIHNHLTATEDGNILVSGISGLGILKKDGTFIEYDDYTSDTSLNWAAADYEGNIWMASSSSGVIKMTKGSFHNHNRQAGLEGVTVNSVSKCAGNYYIATDTGLYICDADWNPVENALTALLDNVRIRHVATDGTRYVWLATYSSSGAVKYDTQTEKIVGYNSEMGILGDRVRVIELLDNGDVAVGTQLGLNIISGDRVVKSYDADNGFATIPVLSMMQLGASLYVGTDGDGIYQITPQKEIIHYGAKEGLEDGVILKMCQDDAAEGCYFVSAGSSLYYFDGINFKKLENFAKGAGSIYDFYLMKDKLWMLQNNGIVAVYRADLLSGANAEVRTYGVEHGLTGTLNANTHNYMDSEGNLYMSTRSGVSVFHFEDVENVVPRGIINSVSVDNMILEHPGKVTLDQNAKRITIDFSALTYTGTTSFKVGYRLEGFDSQETTVSGNHVLASYTNLPGGTYRFHVRIYDPVLKNTLSEYTLVIEKEKKLTEYALFWILLIIGIMLAAIAMFALILKRKTERYKKHQEELQAIVDQSLKTTAKIIDAKDKYTNGHSLRVAYYAREIARRMHLSEAEQKRIHSIALLHDIGKIGIPDSILNKPGKLTPEEYRTIQEHVIVGGDVLEEFSVIEGIQDGARYHHERYDGTGYCSGKKAEEIPLVARIIGVADSYDAMQSNRCYRSGLPKETIISELKNGVGSQFDPNIVPYMLAMIEENIAPIELDE